MSIIKTISTIFLVAVLFSCNKETLTYAIEGTLSEQYSDKLIAGTKVRLYQKEYQSGVLSDNYAFLGETTTDVQGKYTFEIERAKIFEIKVEVEDPDYYFFSKSYSSSLLNSETVNVFNETLEAKSWVAIELKNPFIGPDEQMNVYKSRFREGCEGCCVNGNSSFKETGDTTVVCAAVGGSEVILNYGVVGSNAQFSEIITCIPFDTAFITINY